MSAYIPVYLFILKKRVAKDLYRTSNDIKQNGDYLFISIQKKFDYWDRILDKGKTIGLIGSGEDTFVSNSKRLGIIQKIYFKL